MTAYVVAGSQASRTEVQLVEMLGIGVERPTVSPKSWKWKTTPDEMKLLLEIQPFFTSMIMGGRVDSKQRCNRRGFYDRHMHN